MSEMTYEDLEKEVFAFYSAKAYGQASDLLERERDRFSPYSDEMHYQWIRIVALAGNSSKALQVFKEALDLGYWFAPKYMLRDKDMETLWDLPTFKEYLEVCDQRLAIAQATAKPELLVFQPEKSAQKYPLLLHMHGNAGNAEEASKYGTDMSKQGWLLAIPQSSQIIGHNRYGWDDREKGFSEVKKHLQALSGKYPVNTERVVLSGFSMGGGQAILMALRGEIKTPDFVVLGPYLREDELTTLPDLLAKKEYAPNLRGSILVGEQDNLCLEISRKTAEMLRAHNVPCELEIIPGIGHAYPPDFVTRLANALESL